MRAILIDPWAKEVREVAYGGFHGSPEAPRLYDLLSVEAHTVELVTTVQLAADAVLYLDDEGLLSPGVPLWRWRGYSEPLAGCGLVVGITDEGDDTGAPPEVTAESVRRLVGWTDAESSGDMTPGYTEEAREPDPNGRTFADLTGAVVIHGGKPIPQPRGTHAAKRGGAG